MSAARCSNSPTGYPRPPLTSLTRLSATVTDLRAIVHQTGFGTSSRRQNWIGSAATSGRLVNFLWFSREIPVPLLPARISLLPHNPIYRPNALPQFLAANVLRMAKNRIQATGDYGYDEALPPGVESDSCTLPFHDLCVLWDASAAGMLFKKVFAIVAPSSRLPRPVDAIGSSTKPIRLTRASCVGYLH